MWGVARSLRPVKRKVKLCCDDEYSTQYLVHIILFNNLSSVRSQNEGEWIFTLDIICICNVNDRIDSLWLPG